MNLCYLSKLIFLSLQEVLSKDKIYGIHRQNMIIGFLLYLHSREKILFPLDFILEHYYRKKRAFDELELILNEKNTIYNLFVIEKKENRLLEKQIKRERLFFYFLFTISIKVDVKSIDDDFFVLYDNINVTESNLLRKIFFKLGSSNSTSIKKLKYTKNYYNFMKKKKYKDLITIFNKYLDRKVKLKETKTPDEYLRSKSRQYCEFFNFLEQFYLSEEISKNLLYRIFNFPDSDIYTYQEYCLENLSNNDSINLLLETFMNTDGYTGILNKNKIPKREKSTNPRSAIEDEVIHKIDDIVTNKPPASNYFKNHKVDMDMSWWEHLERVRPFEPLLIKLHLRIPVRGATLRLIDREKLLQYDVHGNIKGFYFVSDKNKNRTKPFIVPNIWKSELSFLIKLIQYSEEYFPNFRRFYPDDITLKEGIIPLFPSQLGDMAYTHEQHLIYWRRVLILTHIELLEDGKDYKLVHSDKVKMPKNLGELDNLTDKDIKTFKIRHGIHALRTTGITNNILAGMPLELVRLLSGHRGFNTILTFYFSVNQEKLVNEWLEKKNIDIPSELDMHQTTNLFIKEEIFDDIESSNSEKILNILNKYNFFNLTNRILSFDNDIDLETISKNDPKFWKPKNGGICTKQKCPKEFTERCSLCPYFISNYMFMPDIGLQVQLSMIKIKKYNDMIIKNREVNENSKNSKIRNLLNEELENFIGWLEVLELSNNSYKEKFEVIEKNNNSLIVSEEIPKAKYTILPSLNTDHGYLDTLLSAYKKKIKDEESIIEITNYIANKLIRYHAKNNTYNEIQDLDNEEIVLNFLPKYEKISQGWYEKPEEKKQLEVLLNMLENTNEKLEYKNENTFLTE